MSIEDVIARSRQPGDFVERKRFAVERANAIRKMRQFALADPHYYVLELIQSAVANGGSSINLSVNKSECVFSYIGGGYDEGALIKLFDFLFAAKSDMAYSALRQLALGVNALLLMSPGEIIIESGDGTLEGTTRVVIMPDKELVDVGTPDHALDGTFVRAIGLQRHLISSKSNLQSTDYGPPETRAIEERCLTLPIPIIVNDRSVFGFSSVRSPMIFGFSRVIAIDEGDLYGSLGFIDQGHNPGFKLLTYGTWVQTVDRPFESGSFGGIISYDRLNKTADHAAIVQDLRYEELWARLQPYARQLVYGKAEAARYEVKTLEGKPLSIRELGELLAERDNAIVVPFDVDLHSEAAMRARRIAQSLGHDTPVLRVQEDDVHRVKYVSRKARVLTPDLQSDRDELFLQKPPVEPPPSPWLLEPVTLKPITSAELLHALWKDELGAGEPLSRAAATLLANKLAARWVDLTLDPQGKPDLRSLYNAVEHVEDGERHLLNEHAAILGAIRPTLYVPTLALASDNAALVRIVSSGRLLWEGQVPSPYPGFVVVLEFDGLMPRHLEPGDLSPLTDSPRTSDDFARLISKAMLSLLRGPMREASENLFDNIIMEDVTPGSAAAQVCLGLLVREGLLRLDSSRHIPRFELTLMRPTLVDVLAAPLFLNLLSEPRSMRQILDEMPSQGGLVYGTIDPEYANLEGLDRARILLLDERQEALLMAAVGNAVYVRVDGRDTLAMLTSPQLVQVRDMVLGDAVLDASMQRLERQDLLISQHVPDLDDPRRRELLHRLVELASSRPSRDLNEEDLRRQALRHIQRFVIRRHFTRQDSFGLDRLPLFVSLHGEPLSMRQLGALIDHARAGGEAHVLMGDGRALDLLSTRHKLVPGAMSHFESSVSLDEPAHGEHAGLAMNPFLAMMLAPYVKVRAAFDFALEVDIDAEASSFKFSSEHFLVSRSLDGHDDEIAGRVGIPVKAPSTRQALVWRHRETGRCYALDAMAQEAGIVGVIEASSIDARACEALLYNTTVLMFEQLLEELPERSSELRRWRRAAHVLLSWSSSFLVLSHTLDEGLHYLVHHPLAQRILDLPLFDTRGRQPLSALALVRSFCNRHNSYSGSLDLFAQLDEDLDPVLQRWLDDTLTLDNVQRQGIALRPQGGLVPPTDDPATAEQIAWSFSLERTLSSLFHRLRPDAEADILFVSVQRPSLDDLAPYHKFQINQRIELFKKHKKKLKDAYTPMDYLVRPAESILYIDGSHWLFSHMHDRRHVVDGSLQEAIAWALLAIYAHLNALLEPITNEHEREFQLRVMAALERGELQLVS